MLRWSTGRSCKHFARFILVKCNTEDSGIRTFRQVQNRCLRTSAIIRNIYDGDGKDSSRNSCGYVPPTLGRDILFQHLCDNQGLVSANKFLYTLQSTGLRLTDPRLQECMEKITALQYEEAEVTGSPNNLMLDRETFGECVRENIVIISRAVQDKFAIPDFKSFTKTINKMYSTCKQNQNGKLADYIPQLSRVNPENWGVSLCTVDGQRHSVGDVHVPFCLQSCCKPLAYALALNDLGNEHVHEYVGFEPSGRGFNELTLDAKNKPHNPMINAGAILTLSLLKNEMSLSDRFDWLSQQFKRLSGGEFIGFNNAVFLSERETADRNFALGHYMKEKKSFPEGTNLMETLDFYFQTCSIEVTCDSAAVMAGTLANGGFNPLTGDSILSTDSVRNTLTLMYSCGMYDYSGEFAFKVGLPGKSGVSGAVLLVIPNLMGMCIWSPRLDDFGNSVRGIEFCQELIRQFNFHHYDNLLYSTKKQDPRRKHKDSKALESAKLLYGAYNADISALRRYSISGIDMGQADYDYRTALHIAAAEGHEEVVLFLLDKCGVPHNPLDRWGFTPLDDARRFGHTRVCEILEAYEASDQDTSL